MALVSEHGLSVGYNMAEKWERKLLGAEKSKHVRCLCFVITTLQRFNLALGELNYFLPRVVCLHDLITFH
jgi:hypothetical protein